MAKLTQKDVTKFECPKGLRDAYLWDKSLPGFGVRAYSTGKKAYVLKYTLPDGRQRKMSLGPVQSGMLDETRKKASSILLQARSGEDFVGQRRAEREAAKARESRDKPLLEHVSAFLDYKRGVVKSSTYRELERHLRVTLAPLHDRKPEDIRRADLVPIIDGLAREGKRITADRTKTSFVQFFNHLVEAEACGANPAAGIKRRSRPGVDGIRTHYHTMNEVAAIWHATDDLSDYSRIIRLLILTGCRRDEIGSLEWSEVNFDERQFLLVARNERSKVHDHLVFLSNPAVELLQAVAPRAGHRHVFGQRTHSGFSGWSKAKQKLDARLGNAVRPWIHHDFRRSFETNADRLGLAHRDVIHFATGHQAEVQKGQQRVYNLYDYEAERRKLMDDWGEVVLEHVSAKEAV